MPAGDPIDDRLRDLLAVEQRLQQLVSDARETAARRLAQAQAARIRLLDEADTAAARADEEEARRDHASHREACRALEIQQQAALAILTSVDDPTIDRLARRALARLLDNHGGTP